MIRERLQAQFLDEPVFNDARSLVNVLESIVDSADSRDDDESDCCAASTDGDAAEVQLLEQDIHDLEAKLAANRRRIARLKADLSVAAPPISGRDINASVLR